MKKYLVPEIDKIRRGRLCWDAFCGGLAMAEGLSATGPVIATDACEPLISLYLAIKRGWIPPESVTKDQWEAAKLLPDSDPMKGFCGFGASFNGMYFSRWVEPEAVLTVKSGPSAGLSFRRRYHGAVGDVLKRQLAKIHAVGRVDFCHQPVRPFDGVIYCDPPYRGTVGYSGAPVFDHGAFYARAQDWANAGVPVFISEYDCPIGACVLDMPAPRGCTMAKKDARERLFYLSPP